MKERNETTFRKRIIDVDNCIKSIQQYLVVLLLVTVLSIGGISRYYIIGEANDNYGSPKEISDEIHIIVIEPFPEGREVVKQPSMEETYEITIATNDEISITEYQSEEQVIECPKQVIGEEEITYVLNLSQEDRSILERIVEAEVTGDENGFRNCTREDVFESKIRVAQVVIERVKSPEFPNTIEGVVFQKNQFSPIGDGRFWKVNICELTKEAVELALRSDTPKYHQGALYFTRGKRCGAKAKWLFTDPVGHSFFK